MKRSAALEEARLPSHHRAAARGNDRQQQFSRCFDRGLQVVGIIAKGGQIGQGIELQRIAARTVGRPHKDLAAAMIKLRFSSVAIVPSLGRPRPTIAERREIVGAVDGNGGDA